MRILAKIVSVLLPAIVIVAACSHPVNTVTQLLGSVPSDASAVFCFNTCAQGTALMLDSTDVLRRCIPPKYSRSPLVLSWCYNGNIVPLLAIQTPPDSSSALKEALRAASSLGVEAAFVSSPKALPGRGVLLLSRSESVVESSCRHLQSGASVLDAPGFRAALDKAPEAEALFFLNNRSVSKWLDSRPLTGVFRRSELVSFIRRTAEWSVLYMPDIQDSGNLSAVSSQGPSDSWYCNLLESQKPARSRMGEILPPDADFAMSLVIADTDSFREAYIRYLDASVRLNRYRNACASLSRCSGIHPEKWEKDNQVREVGLLHRDGSSVLLVRLAKSAGRDGEQLRENPFGGFLAALYGDAFRLDDESVMAFKDHWMVVGRAGDVESLLKCGPSPEEELWPSKPCRFAAISRMGDRSFRFFFDSDCYRLHVY